MQNRKTLPVKENITPMIYEKTRDGEALYDVFSRLVKERIVFLAEEINAEVGTTVSATLLFLDKQNSTKDISLYINSPGGSVCDGLYTIYDTMQFIKSPIRTVNIGEAYSAAAVLLAAGSKGKRSAYANSNTMIHQVQISGDFSGSSSDMEEESKRVKLLNNRIMTTIARHAGQTFSKVKSDCLEDLYLTAEEALEYGLIDSIIKPTKSLPDLVSKKKVVKKNIKK